MVDYNINAITRRVVYTGSAGLGPYAFSFEVIDQADVGVYFNQTLLTLASDYTVTVNANGTGNVNIITGGNVPSTPTASDTVVIIGARDIERVTDFVASGELLASSLNEQLDALTIFDQQLAEEGQRSMRAPVYDPALVADGGTLDMTLPPKADRVDTVMAFDTDGNPVKGPTVSGVTTITALAADIATLADIEDGTVATDAISDAAAIASDITTVSGISGNVTTVSGISSDVTAVAGDATDIGTVATNIANVNTVAGINSDVTTVAGISADVTAAATNVSDIQAISAAIADVITVADDLNEATSEIDVVANNIANVNLVGADIANVNTVATNLTDINSFANTYSISATAPTSPTEGDLWFDTTNDVMKVYDGSGFVSAGSSVNGTSERQTYTATSGQTSFAATYDAGYVDVYLNGVKLIAGTDFTATDGSNVVLTTGAALNDTVDIVAFGTFDVTNVGASLTTLGIDNHDDITVDGSGNVGIGTVSLESGYKLDVRGSGTFTNSSGDSVVKIQTGNTADSSSLYFGDSDDSDAGHIVYDHTFDSMSFRTNGIGEDLIIDSSGNVLVGKSSGSNSVAGVELNSTGQFVATVDSGTHIIGRNILDGTILQLNKDGSPVGSIGVDYGTRLKIGNGDTGLFFNSNSDAIQPISTSSTNGLRDNAIDLGLAASRFKDLYLSGGVYLGGTGSANHLDDYESGSWDVDVHKGGGALAVTARNAGYVRVGNVVHYWFNWRSTTATTTGSDNWEIQGFPFAVVAGTSQGNFINAGYVIINGTGYGDTSPYRWQANSSTALLLYGTQGATNTSSGTTQFSGSGSLEIL